jgi:Na+(H+)/acetate symporter ActP
MIGLAIGGVILWAIAVVWGKKAAAWVVLVVCTVLVFAIALVIGRQLSGDIFDQIHAEHQAASGSQFGGIPVNQFGDPVFTPPPLSSHQGPAATDEFGGVPVGDAFDQIQPDKFTPPPLSSYQGPAPPAPAGGDVFDQILAEQKAQAGAGKLGAIK